MNARTARWTSLGSLVLGIVSISCSRKPDGDSAAAARSAAQASAKPSEPGPAASDREFQIAWSVWTGWMPFKLMEAKGFLARRAADKGIKVKLVEFPAYMDSVTAFAAGKLDGCALTAMEALQPAAAGIDTVAIVVNDTSNGGDGVLVRGIDDLKGLRGKEILLAELSVSHYLLVRGLDSVGMKESDVKIKNTDGDEAGKAFVADPAVEAVTTWNPHLFQATEGGKGKVIFSSKEIPGEIIDLLVVNHKALQEAPQLGAVLTEAWYDAMRAIEDPGDARGRDRDHGRGRPRVGRRVQEDDGRHRPLHRSRPGRRVPRGRHHPKATMEKIKKFSIDHGLVKDTHFAIGYGANGHREAAVRRVVRGGPVRVEAAVPRDHRIAARPGRARAARRGRRGDRDRGLQLLRPSPRARRRQPAVQPRARPAVDRRSGAHRGRSADPTVPFWTDTWASLWILARGLGLGIAISAGLGIAMGVLSTVHAMCSPIVTALAKVPPTALIALFIVLFGATGDGFKIALIAFGISPTLTLGIALVARAVPRNMIVKAYSLGASTAAVVVRGILPQIVPQIVEMIRLAVGPAWIYLIAAEYVNASEGIGHGIVLSMRMVRIDHILVYVVWLALLGTAIDLALHAASRLVAPWAATRKEDCTWHPAIRSWSARSSRSATGCAAATRSCSTTSTSRSAATSSSA